MSEWNEKQGEAKEETKEETKEEVKQGVHNYSSEKNYIYPEDIRLQKKLEWFKDQKLALMMHWGPYSQLGIVESWALSDMDSDWSRGGIDWHVDDATFKKQYTELNKTFNPVRFEPDKWAELAYEGGFKYFIFTTKHHDGFCMWDTKYSDYKITSEDCPFHAHHYGDICKHLFEAMRKKGLGIAPYFSKADWYIPYYWKPNTQRGSFMWRGPSYNPSEDPETWEKFVEFTHNQLIELATGYGKIDILWFDAGWVCEQSGQDIRLGEVVDKIRKVQPWVLSVDRTIGGLYENYITPEQCIPEDVIDVPWESCITIGTSFSFAYEDRYKTPRELVHLLSNVVAKGGNLALNVGPQPDGRIPKGAIDSIKGLGAWLRQFGEAIYGTRICAPYYIDQIAFTKKGKTIYAIKMYEEDELIPNKIILPYKGKVEQVTLLNNGAILSFEYVQEGLSVLLPKDESIEVPIAQVFKLN